MLRVSQTLNMGCMLHRKGEYVKPKNQLLGAGAQVIEFPRTLPFGGAWVCLLFGKELMRRRVAKPDS